MCKVIEDMLKDERKNDRVEIAKRLLFEGSLTLEKIAGCVGLSLEEVKKLQAGHSV